MSKVRIILEKNNKKVGYIIDCDNLHCTSGTFDETEQKIDEVSQEGTITNVDELCQQISWILKASLK